MRFILIFLLLKYPEIFANEQPKVRMHVAIDGKHIGHMEITLFNDTVPKTVNNFLGLSSGSITNTITTIIFYKHFIPELGEYLIRSFEYSFIHGKLSIDQRRAVINLIPKKDKDPLYISNWRPISILNTDYKIIAKCLALIGLKKYCQN